MKNRLLFSSRFLAKLFCLVSLLFTTNAVAELIDNGNGTVTDTITNLTWQQVDNGQAMTWEQAMDYAASSSLGGCTDWRLPNRKELETIVDRTVSDPSINSTLFPQTKSQPYWTGSPASFNSVWCVDFRRGLKIKVNPTSHQLVRLVSAGCYLDRIPPQILSTNPPSGALNVDVAAPVLVSFNEAVAADSVTGSSLFIDGASGALSVQGSIATLSPLANLSYATTYTVHATTGITDLAGNPLAAERTWSFTTAAPPDGNAPTGSVVIAQGASITSSVNVSLTLNASDNSGSVAEMHLSSDGVTWNAWQAYASSLPWVLSSGDGLKSVFVQYRDASGNISPIYSDSIELDSTPPAVSIAPTNVTNLSTLTLSGTIEPGASLVMTVPAPATAGTPTVNAGSWTCSVGNLDSGDTNVTATATDAAGNQRSVQGIITRDNQAPTGSISHNQGEFTRTTLLLLSLSANDDYAGTIQVRLANSGGPWSPWQALTSSLEWRLSDGDGLKTVDAQFSDVAGNLSEIASTSIILDTTPPALSIATPEIITSATALTLNGTAETGVQFNATATNGMLFGAFSQAGDAWQLPVSAIPTGRSTITVTATDAAGNSHSATALVDRDGQAPSGTLIINLGASFTSSRAVSLAVTAEDDIAVTQMRFADQGGIWSEWQTFSEVSSWTLPFGDGLKTVTAQFQDQAGNLSPVVSDSIALDTTDPAITINAMPASSNIVTQFLNGSREAEASVSVSVPGGSVSALTYPDDTNWQAEVSLTEGNNSITVTATDLAGNSASAALTMLLDTKVALAFDAVQTPTSLTSQLISGTRESGAILSLNGTSQLSYPDNTHWQATVSDLQPGENTIQLLGTDALGNVTTISTSIVVDLTPPTGTISINNGAAATGSRYVNLTLNSTDNSGLLSKMRFSNEDLVWGGWQGYTTSLSWILSASGDGIKTVYAQFQDAAGNISTSAQTQIELDTTAPMVTVNAVAPLVTTPEQVLTGTMEADSVVSLSFPGQLLGSISYPTSTTWTASISLAEGVNPITVFATDGLGNRGSIATSMRLDTVADVAITGYVSPTNLPSQTITGSRESDAEISLELPSGVSATPLLYPSATTWETQLSGLQEGNNPISFNAVDPLGNMGSANVTIVVDLQAPQGTVKVNNGALLSNKLTVNLNLTATDNVGPISSARISNDGVTWSQWQDFKNVMPWTMLAGDGEKSVYVQFRDHAGNVSQPVADTITLDTVKPSITINPVTSPTNISSLTVSGTMEDGAVITAAVIGGTLQTIQYAGTTWQAQLTLKVGSNTVYVSAHDAAGNITTVNQYINLDTTTSLTLAPVQSPTSSTTQTLHGTCEANASIVIGFDTAAQAASVIFPTTTTWEAVVSGLQEGTNNLTVTATDSFGNQASLSGSIVVDTTTPLLTLDALASPTNQAQQLITGNREAGTTISVSGVTSLEISYPTSTTWQAQIGLADGINHLVVRGTDSAGNQATVSGDITLDRNVELTVATIPSPTNIATQTLSGTIERGGTIDVITASNNAVVGTISVNGTTWSCPVTLKEGSNLITVSGSDTLANSGQAQIVAVLDTSAPQISINPLPVTTKQTTQAVTGSVEEGATVTLTAPGASVGPVVVNGTSWSCAVTFPQGPTTVTAVARDAATNSSSVQTSITVDSQFQVSIDPLPLQTNQPLQTLSGSVETGYVTLAVTLDTAAELGALSVAGNTWQRSVTLVEGINTITANGSDALGNTGSATRTIRLDTAPPQLTVNPLPAVTTNPLLSLSGTRDSGSLLSLPGSSLQSVIYPTADSWQAQVRLNEGENTLTVRLTDAAGNTISSLQHVVLDSRATFTVSSGDWQTSPTRLTVMTLAGTRDTDVTLDIQVTNGGSASPVVYDANNWNCALTLAEGSNLISVSATDSLGNSSSWSHEVVVDNTAPAPVNLSATDNLVGGSITLSWSGYPVQSEGVSHYLLYASSANFSNPDLLDPIQSLSATTSSFTAQGLTDGVPWYFAVIPVDHAGNRAAFTNATSAVASTQGLYGVVTDSETGLALQSVLVQIDGQSSVTTNQDGFFRKTGVAAGSYSLTVSGQGYQPLQVADVVVTSGEMLSLDISLTPETPLPTKVTNVVATAADQQVTVTWDAVSDANLAGYQLYRGLSPVDTQPLLLTAEPIPGTMFVDMDLNNGTTYYYLVSAVNDEGTAGPASALANATPMATAPEPASDLQANVQADHSVLLQWNPSPTSGVTAYQIYSGANSVDYSTPIAVLDGTARSWTSTIVPTGTTVFYGVRAEKNTLLETNTNLVVSVTISNQTSTVPSVRITTPIAGETIYGSSVPVAADLINGDAANVDRVSFQFRPVGGTTWRIMTPSDMAYQNPDRTSPYLVYWDCRLLTEGQYELRAVASDHLGNNDLQASSSLITIDAESSGKKGWRDDKVRQGQQQTVKRSKTNTLNLFAPQDISPYQVTLPSGTLASDTILTAELLHPEELAHTLPSSATLQRYLRLILGNGQESFATGKEVELAFPYPDLNNDGLVDGLGIPPHALQLMWYNRVSKAWETSGISSVTVDTVQHIIRAKTSHFSDFALLAPGASLTVGINPVSSPTSATSFTLTGTMSEGATVDVSATAGSVGSVSTPTTTTWSCVLSSLPEGNMQVTVVASDTNGSTDPQTVSVLIDRTAPNNGLIKINNGAVATTTRNVTLTLNAQDALSGVAQMIISNNGIPWTSWIPFAPTYDLILPSGDGSKTVYVQYADAAGNQSPVYQDSILLQASSAATVPTGSNVTVQPAGGVKMTFTSVSVAGNLSVTDPTNLSTPPNSVPLWGSERELSTTATYSGSIEVCLGYSDDQLQYPQNEPALRLMHNNGSYWEDITVSVDANANQVCGTTSSLSPFMIVETAPASSDGVSGDRVPVLPGWWLGSLLLIGLGLLRRRKP